MPGEKVADGFYTLAGNRGEEVHYILGNESFDYKLTANLTEQLSAIQKES